MRKLITLLVAAALSPVGMDAQFVVEKNDNSQTAINGNVRFEQAADESWSVAGIGLSEVKSISRVKREGPVELDREAVIDETAFAQYFGDSYESEKGLANYYFLLSNDDFASVGVTNVPAHPGGYAVYFDLFGPLSDDHKNAIIPEGTYTASATKGQYVLNTGLAWACLNTDGTAQGLKEIFFTEGSMEVKHVEGGYDIAGSLTTEDGETFSFHYAGNVHFIDCTGIEDGESGKYLHEDVVVEPVIVSDAIAASLSTDEYDEHWIAFFSTTNLTEDRQHCNEPGVKLRISFLAPKGEIAGTYIIGKMDGWSLENPKPGVIYPGMYMGSVAANTFVEKVMDDYSVRTAIVSGGTLSIVDNGDDTYTIDADFTTSTPDSAETYTVKCSWTGTLEPMTIAPSE